MRTKQTLHTAKESIYLEEGQISDALEMVLSFASLDHLILVMQDGTRVTYTAWEFECEICGNYSHEMKDCPNLEDDDESTD